MAERFVLHVGTPKAGTTYLQTILWANQEALRAAGVLLPGQRAFQHNQATGAVRSGFKPSPATQTWEGLMAEADEFDGTVLLSNEWFSFARPARVAAALERLAPARVEIVVTARDLVSVAPAGWQENLKLGKATSLDVFLGGLEERGRWTYQTLDPAEVLATWGAGLPADQVHVVTVPVSRSEPDLLWRRFAAATGIPEHVVDLDAGARANESLGVESARLLEVLGPRLRAAVDADDDFWSGYRWLRRYLSHTLLVPRGGGRIGLTRRQFRTLRRRGEESVRRIESAGYAVAGDLAELTAATRNKAAVAPEDVPVEDVLDRAADLIADLLRDLRTSSDSGRPVPDNREFG